MSTEKGKREVKQLAKKKTIQSIDEKETSHEDEEHIIPKKRKMDDNSKLESPSKKQKITQENESLLVSKESQDFPTTDFVEIEKNDLEMELSLIEAMRSERFCLFEEFCKEKRHAIEIKKQFAECTRISKKEILSTKIKDSESLLLRIEEKMVSSMKGLLQKAQEINSKHKNWKSTIINSSNIDEFISFLSSLVSNPVISQQPNVGTQTPAPKEEEDVVFVSISNPVPSKVINVEHDWLLHALMDTPTFKNEQKPKSSSQQL